MNILREPLTRAQVLEQQDENGRIVGIVPVDLSAVIDGDLESFLDAVSDALHSSLLTQMDYKVVGVEDGNVLLVEVSGYTDMCDFDEEEAE